MKKILLLSLLVSMFYMAQSQSSFADKFPDQVREGDSIIVMFMSGKFDKYAPKPHESMDLLQPVIDKIVKEYSGDYSYSYNGGATINFTFKGEKQRQSIMLENVTLSTWSALVEVIKRINKG